MNKGMKTLALVLAIGTTASALTSCNAEEYTYPDYHWQEGLIVTVGGKNYEYQDIYNLLLGTKDSAQALYDIAEDIAAQLAVDVTDAMRVDVEEQISDYEDTWRSNADTNGTSYKEEMEKGLDDEGVEDLDELRIKLLSKIRIQANEDAYTQNTSAPAGEAIYNISKDKTKEYVETQRPYHISHILVNVDAAATSSDSTALYDGHISSDNAKKIANVVKGLASSDTFGSVAQLFSDDGSAENRGELGGSKDNASTGQAIGMELDTGFVNEFKLGVYAYDALLNDSVEDTETVKETTRMPTSGEDSSASEILAAQQWNNTDLAQGKVFGIPLSVALEMALVADQEKSDAGLTIQDTDETQYPRNILFNNYFNNHSLSFIYDDSADFIKADGSNNYDKLLKEINATKPEASTEDVTLADIQDPNSTYYKRYTRFNDLCSQLKMIDESKFSNENKKISDNLYTYATTTENYEGEGLVALGAAQKILTNGNGEPILVTRAGADSYQGIHFITINRDPFQTYDANNTPDTYYQYYRVNLPKVGGTGADTPNYAENPSYVNYVQSDPDNNSAYQDRIDAVRAAVQQFDPNVKFARFEDNLRKIGEKFKSLGATTVDEVGKKLFGAKLVNDGEDTWDIIARYIQTNRDASRATDEDSLDSSWSTYSKLLNLQQDITPQRVIPTVCISYFQGGEYSEEMEAICHVKK